MNEELKKKWLERKAAIVYDTRDDKLEDLHNVLKSIGVDDGKVRRLPHGTALYYIKERRADDKIHWEARDFKPQEDFEFYPLADFLVPNDGSVTNYSIF